MTAIDFKIIGVIGAGVMGRGIAQVALCSGREVRLLDVNRNALQDARDEIVARLGRLAEKGRISSVQIERYLGNLSLCDDFADLGDTDLVIEAVIEDAAVKQDLIALLEALLPPTTVIASNTSSFLIAELASSATHPGRVIGLHFFNPVPLMRLVEIVGGASADEALLMRAERFVESLGHVPVRAADVNGFIVNQLGRGYVLEAARIAEDRVAGFACIDGICSQTMGFPMGPFQLMDLTGLDVTYPASCAIWEGNGRDSRFLPPALLARRYKAGLLGRKVGRGFRVNDTPALNEVATGAISPALPIWVSPDHRRVAAPVLKLLEKAGAVLHPSDVAPDDAVVLLPIDGGTLLRTAYENELDAERCLGFDPDFPGKDGVVLVRSRVTCDELVGALAGIGVRVIEDGFGTLSQRIALQLALIAGDMIDRGVATEAAIDQAAVIALGHTEGPLQRARRIGLKRLENVRARIFAASGADRFRPSRWLTDLALLDG